MVKVGGMFNWGYADLRGGDCVGLICWKIVLVWSYGGCNDLLSCNHLNVHMKGISWFEISHC